jgi:hypothetical protein
MRSAICPFIPGEDAKARHARRLDVAVDFEPIVRAWVRERGGTLTVNNGTHHWQIKIGKLMVQWWPSTAKCVRGQNWGRAIKIHDFKQLIVTVEGWLSMKGKK